MIFPRTNKRQQSQVVCARCNQRMVGGGNKQRLMSPVRLGIVIHMDMVCRLEFLITNYRSTSFPRSQANSIRIFRSFLCLRIRVFIVFFFQVSWKSECAQPLTALDERDTPPCIFSEVKSCNILTGSRDMDPKKDSAWSG